jgi:hypothetical protein
MAGVRTGRQDLAPFFSRPELLYRSEFSALSGFALRPPQLHHLCVAAHGVRWGLTAVGALQEPLRFGLWRSMEVNRRFRDRSENHGVPGSNPDPTTS